MNERTNTGATLYEETNFAGSSKFFAQSEEEYSLPDAENDFYNSVKVNPDSLVFAWQHYQQGGKYQEWEGEDSDISDLGGLSVFKVVPNSHVGVAMRLINGTGSDTLYCLYSQVHGSNAKVESYSNNPDYQLVGTLDTSAGGEHIIASVAVRNTETNTFLNNGSVYFRTDGNGDVHVSHDNGEFDNFPKNMKIEETSPNHFDLTLISEEPA